MHLVVGASGSEKAVTGFSRGSGEGKRRGARAAGRPLPVAPVEGPSFATSRRNDGADGAEIVILDSGGRIVAANTPWRETLAASGFIAPDAGLGAAYVDVVRRFLEPADVAALETGLDRLLEGGLEEVRRTCVSETPAGLRWRQVQITPLSSGAAGHFVAVHEDRTELATARAALKSTSEQLLTARDDERQRIALELHDSTCQHLAAINLRVSRLRRAAAQGGLDATLLDEIAQSLDEAIKETRVLSYLVKPRDMGRGGLSATVLEYLEGFARRTGLEVSLEADKAVDGVAEPLQHAALRIVQEALTNAHRHAQARRVSVELGVDAGLLKVSVTDDGRGLPSDEGEASLGVGIPGMRARAQEFSGEVAILSDESGTRVVALLPLP